MRERSSPLLSRIWWFVVLGMVCGSLSALFYVAVRGPRDAPARVDARSFGRGHTHASARVAYAAAAVRSGANGPFSIRVGGGKAKDALQRAIAFVDAANDLFAAP